MWTQIWIATAWCLCSFYLLKIVNADVEDQVIFQSEDIVLQCEHGLTAEKLTQIEWKINGKRCASVKYIAGAVDDVFFDCNLQSRTDVTRNNITISTLMVSDEGEFQCSVENDYAGSLQEVVTYNVVVRVRPGNHTLLQGGVTATSSSCVTGETVSGTQDSTTLNCSVDSKPAANITWSIVPDSNKSWQNVTTCYVQGDKIFHCINALTIPKEDIPTRGSQAVTCHIQVYEDTSDRCITYDRTDAGGSANQLGSWSVVYLVCWALVLLH